MEGRIKVLYKYFQNGMLLVFDVRQTSAPLHSMTGLSTHPVHTIHSAVDGSGSRKVFSASSIGPCIWDVDGSADRYALVKVPTQFLLTMVLIVLEMLDLVICSSHVQVCALFSGRIC